MRFLRAFFVSLLTAIVSCVLALFVGDYLTRLAHASEMEGQRGMMVVFLGAPLGVLAGLVIGIIYPSWSGGEDLRDLSLHKVGRFLSSVVSQLC
jgi:hypothetical protein